MVDKVKKEDKQEANKLHIRRIDDKHRRGY